MSLHDTRVTLYRLLERHKVTSKDSRLHSLRIMENKENKENLTHNKVHFFRVKGMCYVICLFSWIIEIAQMSGKRNMILTSVQIRVYLPDHNDVVIVLILLCCVRCFSFINRAFAVLCENIHRFITILNKKHDIRWILAYLYIYKH